jgi:uncharacterized membrane protein YdjX (TVP38/TMEM64 family)
MSTKEAASRGIPGPAAAGQRGSAWSSAAGWVRWVRLGSLGIIVVSLVLLVQLLPVKRLVELVSAWVEGLGALGPAAFGLVYVLAAVLFVPGSLLTIASGTLFGLVAGTVVVSVASTTAAALAFLIGRYLARDAVRQWAARNPRFGAIDRAIGEGGWRIIALLRLSPAVPFSVGNYLFGVTSIRFVPYVLASWVAMLPGTFMYVYLGHAGRAGLTAAASGGDDSRTPGQWALLVVGLLATVAVTIYVTRLARKAIKEQALMPDEPSDPITRDAVDAGPRRGIFATALTLTLALVLAACTVYAYTNRSVITRLFGPPAVTLQESYEEKPGGPTFDHGAFTALLEKYVDAAGLVDYRGLAADAKALDAYLAALARAPLDGMGRNERLAFLINAYNAFTLRLILDHYPLKSIKDIPEDQRWDAKRWKVGGKTWSLNQIEHEQIRPHFKEPRIHFALVCAAIGCPPLRREAYTAGRLEKQLEAQARYVHGHDRWFQFDPDANVVKRTELYDWYGGDFQQVAGSVVEYAARYSPDLRKALDAGRRPNEKKITYDWDLNVKEKR